MFKLSTKPEPETGFISLDEFCENPTYTDGQVILFDNEDDFITFCVAPVADKNLNGQYTEMYQQCLKTGMKFGIRKRNSKVNTDKKVSARVLLPKGLNQLQKDVPVTLSVQGIKTLPAWYCLCDGQVYTWRSIVDLFVYKLIYEQSKTEAEVRTILQSCCQDIISNEQFEELDQDEKEQYNSFSIKLVKYYYRNMSGENLINVAAQNDIRIENLVIK